MVGKGTAEAWLLFPGGFGRDGKGVSAFILLFFCFAWSGSPLLLTSFFFLFFPDFYSPLVFRPYGLAAEVIDTFGLLSFLFWFEGARWEVERSINRHI